MAKESTGYFGEEHGGAVSWPEAVFWSVVVTNAGFNLAVLVWSKNR